MSHVCPLCNEYTQYLSKLTTQPDMPSQVRDYARICTTCKTAIKNADTSRDDDCPWCGDSTTSLWELWYTPGSHGMEGKHRVGHLCTECLAIAEGNYPIDFDKIKPEMRKRDDFQCQKCGMPQGHHIQEFGQKLHVHHKDGDKRSNEPENLITLCARCHGSI